MSTIPPVPEAKPFYKKSWSEFTGVDWTIWLATVFVPVICCAGLLNMPDDADQNSPDEVATVIETTASESPTEPEPTTRAAPTEAATSASPEPPPETTEAEEEVYYENCDAVRDAGAAPIHDGEPGYRAGLDSDGDGEGCEDSSDSGSDSGGGGGGNDDDDDDGDGGGSVYYENCDAVRDAGAAPIHVGEPGYGSHLDRDGDGTGCE